MVTVGWQLLCIPLILGLFGLLVLLEALAASKAILMPLRIKDSEREGLRNAPGEGVEQIGANWLSARSEVLSEALTTGRSRACGISRVGEGNDRIPNHRVTFADHPLLVTKTNSGHSRISDVRVAATRIDFSINTDESIDFHFNWL